MKKLLMLFLGTMLFSVVLIGQELPDNWTPGDNITTYQETNDPHGGAYSCKVDVGGVEGGVYWLTNDITITGLTAGASYSARAYVKSSTNVRVSFKLTWGDNSTAFSGSSQGQPTWNAINKNGTVPAGVTTVSVAFRFQPQTGFVAGEEQWLDDFTFECPTGTPLTVANGDFESWPPLGVEPAAGDLVINEINSRNPWQSRYTELYNTTSNTLELNKVDIEYVDDGTSYTLSLAGTLAPNAYYLLARHGDFPTYYPGVSYDVIWDGQKLNGGSDYIRLIHDDNGVIDQFNDSGSPETWTVNSLFYRFDYSADGSSIVDDWDNSGANLTGTPKAENMATWDPETGNGNWNTATNWVPEGVPTKGVNVVIIAGTDQPFVGSTDPLSPNECMDLTIPSGGWLTVGPGKFITVHGHVTNNAGPDGLKIRSTADGNGSFILYGTMTGDARVERYVAGYTNSDDGWHTIGAPVSMTIAGTGWEPGTISPDIDDLYYWSEADNMWMNWKVTPFNFVQGNGYLVAYETSQTNNFEGTLTTADVTHTNLSRVNDGYHMIGNPYSCAIDWNNNTDWVFNNIGSVPSIWDENGGTYANPGVGDPIPSTNGFFVQVAPGAGGNNSITVPASARIHDAQNNYKSTAAMNEDYTLKMKVSTSANSFYNNARISFQEDASTDWDLQYDALKLYGNASAPELWTMSEGMEFSVNTLPFSLEAVSIPLHFKAGVDGQFEIAFEGTESFMGNVIELEDTFLNQTIDLVQQPVYNFSGSQEDDFDRFILHFYGVTSIEEIPREEIAFVYADENMVYIRFNQAPANDYTVDVYNTLGQSVYSKKMAPATLNSFILDEQPGMYIVRVTSGNERVAGKVMVK